MTLFSRDETRNAATRDVTVITEGMTITGDVAVTDNVYINGKFSGQIVARGEIAVGPNGKLEGTIRAGSLRVAGFVDGDIECGTLNILPGGKVFGTICSDKMEMHSGGFLDADHRQRTATPATSAGESPAPPACDTTEIHLQSAKKHAALSRSAATDTTNRVTRLQPLQTVAQKPSEKAGDETASEVGAAATIDSRNVNESKDWFHSWRRREAS